MLTKLYVLAALCLELLTCNSHLAALDIVENGWSINRACRQGSAPVLLCQVSRQDIIASLNFTYEDLAVSASCDFNLRGVVQQINPVQPHIWVSYAVASKERSWRTPYTTTRWQEATGFLLSSTHVQSVRFLSAKLSLQHNAC